MTSKTAPLPAAPRATARKSADSPPPSASAATTSAARTRRPSAARRQVSVPLQPKLLSAEAAEHSSAKANKKPAKQRPVLVRDSFTMPEADFALLAMLKAKALSGQRAAKKSELLRAGLQLLATLDEGALVAALDRLEAVKTGRPKKKG